MTETVHAIVLEKNDNVGTILTSGLKGAGVECGDLKLTLQDPVPYGHKVALYHIGSGEPIIKYGVPIGVAARDIAPGEHVHVSNVLGYRAELRGGIEE